MVLVQVVEHDVARTQFGTTPALGWSLRRKKRNSGAPMHMSYVQYTRDIIEEPLHLQATQADPDEFRRELSARGDRQLRLRSSERCRPIVRIGGCANRARRHPNLPGGFYACAYGRRLAETSQPYAKLSSRIAKRQFWYLLISPQSGRRQLAVKRTIARGKAAGIAEAIPVSDCGY